MTTQQAKETFNQVAAQHRATGNLDQAARIELAREYFCNPDFRKTIENYLWERAV